MVVLLAGSAVALAGPIGFVGLVVPHIARLIVGVDYRWIIPFSALGGALLLVAADAPRALGAAGTRPAGRRHHGDDRRALLHLSRPLPDRRRVMIRPSSPSCCGDRRAVRHRPEPRRLPHFRCRPVRCACRRPATRRRRSHDDLDRAAAAPSAGAAGRRWRWRSPASSRRRSCAIRWPSRACSASTAARRWRR